MENKFEEYKLEKSREKHLKNKHYKYKVVFDNGKPYEEFFDNDEDLRTALKNFYEKNKDNIFFKKARTKIDLLKFVKDIKDYYHEDKAPKNFPLKEFVYFIQAFTDRDDFMDNKIKKKSMDEHPFRALFVAGMHFQDAYNYEAERSERCLVHYAAPDGKLYPFCTYNCGPYYRDKVERKFAQEVKKGK